MRAALPGNTREVEAKSGFGKTTVWRWLNDMHAAGEIHIIGWKRVPGGGPFMPTYALGEGVDAPILKPLTESQKSKRHRRKAKADGRWDDRKAKARANYWADRAQTNRDPMIEALFGPARRQPEPTTQGE